MAAGYSCIWHDMFANALDHTVYDPRRIIQRLKNGKTVGLIVTGENGEETQVPLNDVQHIKPFIMSGYWNRIIFNPSENNFNVSGLDTVKTDIPRISKQSFYQTEMVRKSEDVDNARLLGFLETAVSKALMGDNAGSADLRVRRTDERPPRAPYGHKPKTTTRWIKERDSEDDENLTSEDV